MYICMLLCVHDAHRAATCSRLPPPPHKPNPPTTHPQTLAHHALGPRLRLAACLRALPLDPGRALRQAALQPDEDAASGAPLPHRLTPLPPPLMHLFSRALDAAEAKAAEAAVEVVGSGATAAAGAATTPSATSAPATAATPGTAAATAGAGAAAPAAAVPAAAAAVPVAAAVMPLERPSQQPPKKGSSSSPRDKERERRRLEKRAQAEQRLAATRVLGGVRGKRLADCVEALIGAHLLQPLEGQEEEGAAEGCVVEGREEAGVEGGVEVGAAAGGSEAEGAVAVVPGGGGGSGKDDGGGSDGGGGAWAVANTRVWSPQLQVRVRVWLWLCVVAAGCCHAAHRNPLAASRITCSRAWCRFLAHTLKHTRAYLPAYARSLAATGRDAGVPALPGGLRRAASRHARRHRTGLCGAGRGGGCVTGAAGCQGRRCCRGGGSRC